MNLKTVIALIVLVLCVFTAIALTKMTGNSIMEKSTKIKLETNYGDIVIQLYKDMPITSGNFEKLVSQGFYDDVTFHRIIENFMIQGGDPTGTGSGGPGYNIKDEFTHNGGNKNNRELFQWQMPDQILVALSFL